MRIILQQFCFNTHLKIDQQKRFRESALMEVTELTKLTLASLAR